MNRQTSVITISTAGVEVFETDGLWSGLPGLSFITPVALAMASTPDSASTTPTNPRQFTQKPPVSGLTLCQAVSRCGKAKAPSNTTTATVGTAIRNASPPV